MNAFSDIRLIAMDCDGVLTDGAIIFTEGGDEIKAFDVADGLGIMMALRAGLQVAVLSGRRSEALARRAQELGIRECHQGLSNKAKALQMLAARLHLETSRIAYIGDDLNDLPAFSVAGARVAVANAAPEIKAQAHYTTARSGGHGAVREAIEAILKAQGRWEAALAAYLKEL